MIALDIERLLRDHGIPFVTWGEHAHSTEGWLNVHCPFCPGSQDFHLGIHREYGGCHCWRCGSHRLIETLAGLLNQREDEVRRILRKYQGIRLAPKKAQEPKVSIHPFRLPRPHSPNLTARGSHYLRKRGFDPDRIENTWSLMETGPISSLDGISYALRILIPIFWNGEMVSFQARDMTDRSDRKYLACPMRREALHHKNLLYGDQEIWSNSDTIIIVEGVTDVWRLGPLAVATFGIEFTNTQVLQLARSRAHSFFIIFDAEPQAQWQARKLAVKLKALGRSALPISIQGDPGSLEQSEADRLVYELTSRD